MPITFNCPCGKALRIADEHAGKRIKCPACQALGTAPKPEQPFEVVEEPKEQLAPAPAKPTAKPVARPAAKPARDDDDDPGFTVEDEDEQPKKKASFSKGSRRDRDEDEDERPRKKKKRRRDDDDDYDRPRRRPPSDTGKKVLYLIGGLLLVCAGAALAYFGWQGEGRGATKAVIFGICLVVGGLGTSVKGITGNFDDDE